MQSTPPRKPGDAIIDRYLPGTTDAEREQARRELQGFAASIFDVWDRIAREKAIPTPDSHESGSQDKIQPTP